MKQKPHVVNHRGLSPEEQAKIVDAKLAEYERSAEYQKFMGGIRGDTIQIFKGKRLVAETQTCIDAAAIVKSSNTTVSDALTGRRKSNVINGFTVRRVSNE